MSLPQGEKSMKDFKHTSTWNLPRFFHTLEKNVKIQVHIHSFLDSQCLADQKYYYIHHNTILSKSRLAGEKDRMYWTRDIQKSVYQPNKYVQVLYKSKRNKLFFPPHNCKILTSKDQYQFTGWNVRITKTWKMKMTVIRAKTGFKKILEHHCSFVLKTIALCSSNVNLTCYSFHNKGFWVGVNERRVSYLNWNPLAIPWYVNYRLCYTLIEMV